MHQDTIKLIWDKDFDILDCETIFTSFIPEELTEVSVFRDQYFNRDLTFS